MSFIFADLSICMQQGAPNELKNFFNHRIHDGLESATTLQEQSKRHLELGKLVFNFSQKPIITLLPERSSKKNKRDCFFFFHS